jgi:hypothetical protein
VLTILGKTVLDIHPPSNLKKKFKAGKTHPKKLFLEIANSSAIQQRQMIYILCEISVSHGDDYENYYLLGCVAM